MSTAGRERSRMVVAAIAAALAIACLAPAASSAANGLAVHGSVNQVYVTGGQSGTSLRLVRKGKVVSRKPVGTLGGVVFRRLASGKGYRVRAPDGSFSRRIAVMSPRPPKNTSIYSQTLPAGGYGYAYTRDGTSLSLDVRLPGPAEDGPYPTVVEYAGYGFANPAGEIAAISRAAGNASAIARLKILSLPAQPIPPPFLGPLCPRYVKAYWGRSFRSHLTSELSPSLP